MKRDIKITVSNQHKTCEVWIDGVFYYSNEYKYTENAIQAANAYADQYSHHAPTITIDMRG